MRLQAGFYRVWQHLKGGTLVPAIARRAFETKFRFLVNSSPYNQIYSRVIKKKSKETVYPDSINIETVNLCNASCIFCPRTSLTRKNGIMREAIFRKIIQRVSDENLPLKTVCLNGFGEPLLDKRIFDRIKYVKDKLHCSTIIFTNGQLLDRENAIKMIASGLDEVNISFNAMFKQDYEKVMGISYDKTVRNIKGLLSLRRNTPKVYISCVYSKKYTFDETEFLRRWGGVVDSVFMMPAEVFGDLTKDDVYTGYGYRAKKWPCFRLWKNAWVSMEGDIYMCCKDVNGGTRVGNLVKSRFSEAWHSPSMEKIRRIHLDGKQEKISLCKDCEVLIRSSTGWWF